MPQHYSWIRVILVNKANIKAFDDMMMMLAIVAAMIAILVTVTTMKVKNTEYLLPCSGSIPNALCITTLSLPNNPNKILL